MIGEEMTGDNGELEEQPLIVQKEAVQKIGIEEIHKANGILQTYKDGKANLERRIVENEQWWKMRHWDMFRGNKKKGDIEPSSAWLFNSIANKHADALDNYPEPNVLARALDDEGTAGQLSKILPVVLENNSYDQVYSDVWWYKLKQGTGVKGVFWNTQKENGLGDVDIRKIDILNLFWEPGISDIQDSSNLFHVSMVNNDTLSSMYPDKEFKGIPAFDVARYIYDDNVNVDDKSIVVDWYYKVQQGGKSILHYVKYVNDEILFATENEKEYMTKGFYDHGKYPFVFDTLFVEEGTPCGFGYIDIMKDTQMYIDKLNQCIIDNALQSAKKRWLVADQAGINDDDFEDMTKTILHVPNLNENTITEVTPNQLPAVYVNILQNKIEELKETSGNRDISQGSTSNGVTAASAISALMEAGSKLSRDMISSSYRSFVNECYLTIELMRQFYELPRCFRITGEGAENIQYTQFDNSGLIPQAQGNDFGIDLGTRLPVFDIKVSASKKAVYSRMSQNELAIQLFGLGVFNPQMSDQALALIDIMDFDGKEKVAKKVTENGTMYNQMQKMQSQMQQMAQVIDGMNNERGQATNIGDMVNAQNGQMVQSMPQGVSNNKSTPQAEKTADRARNATAVGGNQ